MKMIFNGKIGTQHEWTAVADGLPMATYPRHWIVDLHYEKSWLKKKERNNMFSFEFECM